MQKNGTKRSRIFFKGKKKAWEKDPDPQIPETIGFIREACLCQKRISDGIPDDHQYDMTARNDRFLAVLKPN